MARMGMVIDLQKCTSCGACALGCKTENNTRTSTKEATFNWADFMTFTEGEFPNSKFVSIPVLCNHCTDAPCVAICPVTPKAMFKTSNGITMHNDERCIGCGACIDACPYSSRDISKDGSLYSVISLNPKNQPTHPFYADSTSVLPGGTTNPVELVTLSKGYPPNFHEFEHPDYSPVRRAGVTEKCTLCDHRAKKGESPYCVTCCPPGARIVGDFDDPNSEVSKLIKKHSYFRLKNNLGDKLKPGEKGTSPNVYYIGSFENVITTSEKEEPIPAEINFAKVFPNPATSFSTLEITNKKSGYMDCAIYTVDGKLVAMPWQREFVSVGVYTYDLPVSNMMRGTYFIKIVLNGNLKSLQLIIL